jgi:hypothetical protein
VEVIMVSQSSIWPLWGEAGRGATTLFVVLSLAACGGKDDGPARASSVPRSAGDVWVLDSAASRAAAPAAMLAYANGLHVLVLDGGKVYSGMTRLQTTRVGGDTLELRLPGSLQARLTPNGNSMELTFSTGERIGMHKRQQEEGK